MAEPASCSCETTCVGNSNASTTTRAYGDMAASESVFFNPVASIVSICVPLERFLATNTGTWTSYDLANMSTSDTKTPSRYTRAMPLSRPRMPNHVTEVPVNVNVACAPGVMVSMALPPLHPNQPVSWFQPVPKLTDGSVSSYRLTADGGAGALETVIVTGAEVVRLPAASRATAVRVCEPLLAVVVSHEMEYGAAASSAPPLTPSSWNWTPATPRSSGAVAVTEIVPETVAP